jgi:hypothetical protein
MVFVPSAKAGEELRGKIAELGLDIPLYHSRLGTPLRGRNCKSASKVKAYPQ